MTTKLTKEERISRMRDLLTKAVDNHLKGGGKIISGTFRVGDSCCPIRCAVGGGEPFPYEYLLSQRLGYKLSYEEMFGFIHGFDGGDLGERFGYDRDFFKLGTELRDKYADKINHIKMEQD